MPTIVRLVFSLLPMFTNHRKLALITVMALSALALLAMAYCSGQSDQKDREREAAVTHHFETMETINEAVDAIDPTADPRCLLKQRGELRGADNLPCP